MPLCKRGPPIAPRRWRVSVARDAPDQLGPQQSLRLNQDLLEEAPREPPVNDGARLPTRNRPQVRPGPGEYIVLAHHDPAPIGIETEASPLGLRNLDGGHRVVGRRMGDRNDDALTLLRSTGQNESYGTVLLALVTALICLTFPKIAITKDCAGNRGVLGNHVCLVLLWVLQLIGNFGLENGPGNVIRNVVQVIRPTIPALETSILLI